MAAAPRPCPWSACGLLLLLVGLAPAAAGCNSGSTEPPQDSCRGVAGGLLLRLTGPDGQTPASYRVIVAADAEQGGGAGTQLDVSCGQAAAAAAAAGAPASAASAGATSLVCDARGARLSGAVPASLQLTVRSPGLAFLARQLQPGPASDTGCWPAATVTLAALPPFEVKQGGYRTGFAAEDGRNAFEQLAYPLETELGPSEVVKFYIGGILEEQPRVYFQDTLHHPDHYDFVRTVLGLPGTSVEFFEATYHGADRTAMAGSLLLYPRLEARSGALGGPFSSPVIVTFFPGDDLTPQQALLACRLLEERLLFVPQQGAALRLFYLPAGELQEGQLDAAADTFRRQGTLWLTRQEMYGSVKLQLLNPGLAYGTLRLLTPEQLVSAMVSFRDILVLPRLPNDLPIVGGTITGELQTPLAHVNVAARTRGTPNVALIGAEQDPRVAPLFDQLVRFEVKNGDFTLRAAAQAEAEEFWAHAHHDPYSPPADVARTGLPAFAELHFADSASVGVKAANLAELSRLLGALAPDGFAIPFHYYDRYVKTQLVTATACTAAKDDCLGEGRTAELCGRAQELCQPPQEETLDGHAARLLADPGFLADSPLREASLASLRYLIAHGTVDPQFAADLDALVQQRFGNLPIRLRSSTNSEDLLGFSGAGLYTSYGAQLGAGTKKLPSRVVRKVWASVWNWSAFEERSFWSIDHLAVKMGVAVHPAYQDEDANGVLITQNIADPSVAGMYVNVQLGEMPVTNPEQGALPEIISILPLLDGSFQVARQRFSSLQPDQPLLSLAEVGALYQAAQKVQVQFAPLYHQDVTTLALDIEFKFHGPDRALILKQVRPYTPGKD